MRIYPRKNSAGKWPRRLMPLILSAALGLALTPGTRGGPAEAKEILYYTCGMHPSVRVSPAQYEKGKTTCPICNMNLVPVYRERAVRKAKGERKIAYYRNPMNPEITSPVPAKDSMGMDYLPVYEDEIKKPAAGGGAERLHLSPEQIERAGVRTVAAKKLHLFKKIRAVGRIAYDPELAVAQEEFISALQSLRRFKEGAMAEIIGRGRDLVEAARRKLLLLGMSREQVTRLEKSGKVQTNLILPGDTAWVYADIYESELNWIKEGQAARVTAVAFPGEEYKGQIISIDPTLNPATRSVRIRLEIENPGRQLKPDMYVDVVIDSPYITAGSAATVLAVPREAILDTGLRKIAWVDRGGGEFEGREVKVGPLASAEIDGRNLPYLPVLRGLREGDLVVVRGNFLIDSQSRLTGGASAAYGGALGAGETPTMPPEHQHQ